MTDSGKKDPQELLEELESIKTLLDSHAHDEIPLLEEMVPDLASSPLNHHETVGQDSQQNFETSTADTTFEDSFTEPTTPGVLPGQQSLFNEQQKTPKQNPSITPSSASNENPFLPKHIRERLKSKTGIAGIQQPSKTDSKLTFSTEVSTNIDQIVDTLVKEYLPKIEQRLRQQLLEQVKQGTEEPPKKHQ